MSKPNNPPSEILIYAASEQDADAFYFGRVFVPDPFIAFSCGKQRIAVVNQLEYARVRKEGQFDEVLPLEAVAAEARKHFSPHPFRHPVDTIRFLAAEFGLNGFCISGNFPAGIAFALRDHGLRLTIEEGTLFPNRAIKNDEEANAIREGNAASAAGFKAAERILKSAQIRGNRLYHGKQLLTSERLRETIDIAVLQRGATAHNTIVAGGDQACDPHCRGYGPLRPDSLIIIDIFPRVQRSGYHGDMTRTYLKGRPSEEQKKLVATVFEAQQWAITQHTARASGKKIYDAVCRKFQDAGYRTHRENGIPSGFIHGLGHGLGLDVHEAPRVNSQGDRLKKGQVITVEPGLYYPGLGGCRIEDVVRVGIQAPELLSHHPYRWQFR